MQTAGQISTRLNALNDLSKKGNICGLAKPFGQSLLRVWQRYDLSDKRISVANYTLTANLGSFLSFPRYIHARHLYFDNLFLKMAASAYDDFMNASIRYCEQLTSDGYDPRRSQNSRIHSARHA
ncbi:MAG: hypothetical protein M3O74_25005 [Pseudomonadota bacterium]|nr:hypothetical protein [Pseudomonadota bacterium]